MSTVRVLLIDTEEAPPLLHRVSAAEVPQFRLTRKATLSEGLTALQESSFQLILLSLSLPDASAIDSIQRTLRTAPNLPVIVLVNEAETTKAADALRHGMLPYVLKGCHCDSLVRTMQYAIERQQLISDTDRSRHLMTKSREELTAHLSHELRNALACIHQFGNILIDGLAGKLLDEQREYVGIMLENSKRIRTVLDSLLEAGPKPANEHEDNNGRPLKMETQ